MSVYLDDSKQWCCPNCGTPWKKFFATDLRTYPACQCSVVAGPGTIMFQPVECDKIKREEQGS